MGYQNKSRVVQCLRPKPFQLILVILVKQGFFQPPLPSNNFQAHHQVTLIPNKAQQELTKWVGSFQRDADLNGCGTKLG